MPIPSVASRATVVLVDANVMIEAVKISCWNAVAGGLRLETVEECRNEVLQGSPHRPGYVIVSKEDLSRLAMVHPVTDLERATFGMAYPDAANMHAGERDLFAHAYGRIERRDDVWVVCSPDKASIRAAVGLDWRDHLCSLESMLQAVGMRVRFAHHFGERWLADFCTLCLLGR